MTREELCISLIIFYMVTVGSSKNISITSNQTYKDLRVRIVSNTQANVYYTGLLLDNVKIISYVFKNLYVVNKLTTISIDGIPYKINYKDCVFIDD